MSERFTETLRAASEPYRSGHCRSSAPTQWRRYELTPSGRDKVLHYDHPSGGQCFYSLAIVVIGIVTGLLAAAILGTRVGINF